MTRYQVAGHGLFAWAWPAESRLWRGPHRRGARAQERERRQQPVGTLRRTIPAPAALTDRIRPQPKARLEE